MSDQFIDIVFDGPPSHESGRFVEVEDASGKGISVGEWIKRADGYWVLRIAYPDSLVDAYKHPPELEDREDDIEPDGLDWSV